MRQLRLFTHTAIILFIFILALYGQQRAGLINITYDTDNGPPVQWNKKFGNGDSETALKMVQNSDGGFTVCGVSHTRGVTIGYVLKVSHKGQKVWDRYFDSENVEALYDVMSLSNGDIVVCGQKRIAKRKTAAVIIRLDKKGHVVWEKVYKGKGKRQEAYAKALSEGPKNSIIVIGSDSKQWGKPWIVQMFDSGRHIRKNTIKCSRNSTPSAIVKTKNNQFVYCGTSLSSKGRSKVHIIKLSKKGQVYWERFYGGRGKEVGNDIVQTSDRGFAICGTTTSYGPKKIGGRETSSNCWVMKLDRKGYKKWAKAFGSSSHNEGLGITVGDRNSLIVCGEGDFITGENHGGFWTAKLSNKGDLLWEKNFGGRDRVTNKKVYSTAQCILTTREGNVVFAGRAFTNRMKKSQLCVVNLQKD